VDIDFGDYLRALITADRDVVVNDTRGYRLAFIDAFRQHGIFPRNLRSLSEESLLWDRADEINSYGKIAELGKVLREFYNNLGLSRDRRARWGTTRGQRAELHAYLQGKFWHEFNDPKLQEITGLDFGITKDRAGENVVRFEVHAMWRVQRQRLDGSVLNQVVFSILQHKPLDEDEARVMEKKKDESEEDWKKRKKKVPQIWGGCTFIVDLGKEDEQAIRYVIRKPLYYPNPEGGRIKRARKWAKDPAMMTLGATYGMDGGDEPFAMLHSES
jgi:uncharacterized protein YaeQ